MHKQARFYLNTRKYNSVTKYTMIKTIVSATNDLKEERIIE